MQWLGDELNATLKETQAGGQVWLQGASGMEHRFHGAGPRDHGVGAHSGAGGCILAGDAPRG